MLFCIFFVSLIVNGVIKRNLDFANTIHGTVGAGIRAVMSTVTSWIPFSLAEIILMLTPIWLFLLIFLAIKYGKEGKKASHHCVVVDKVYFCESKKVTEDEKIDDSDLPFG